MKSCVGCKYEKWIPEKSSEPWCNCDICDDYDYYEPSNENEDEVKTNEITRD